MGGHAAAAKLTPTQRTARARHAAVVRHAKNKAKQPIMDDVDAVRADAPHFTDVL